MATRVIDDSKLQDIAVAIQGKDGGGTMTVDEMPTRIAEIPTGGGSVEKKDVNFYDWEGTLLFGYSVEEVQAMTSLPAPDTSPNYQSVDHDLLTFQKWTRSLANIKTWVQSHGNQSLGVGAIYTTTDLQNHNYWNNPRLTNAKSIYMQKRGVTSISRYAFQSCTSLTSINIPDGVDSIGGYAFQDCYSLTSINIPDGVDSIGSNAFQSCYSLTSINIPDGVTSISSYAFQNCYSLTSINVPDGVDSIGSYAFYNCTSLTSINIPDGVTSISSYAFQNCYSLTSINVPDGVDSISSYAFYNCYSLTSINVPDGVDSIGSYAFQSCTSLTSINVPDGVDSIGSNAFQSCRELYDIVIHGKPALSNTNAFGGAPSDQKIYVHRSDLSWYETKTNWSRIYAQGKIVAAADYLDHLISIGIDVTDFENEVISE